MGFTRTHFVGVFATESFLCVVGIALAGVAAATEERLSVRLLLGALCSLALAIAILLASILSLLFFVAWPNEADASGKVEDLSDPFV